LLPNITAKPHIPTGVFLIDHHWRSRKTQIHPLSILPRGGDFERARIDFRQHFRKYFPDRHLQRLIRAKSRDFLGRAIEQINASLHIRGNEAGAQAIDDAVAEGLKKCNLARRLLEFDTGLSTALGEEV